MFEEKKVFVIGDKDGVPAPIIEKCLGNFKEKVVFATTECFSCSIAGVMTNELQKELINCVEKYGAENIVVILGGSDAEASASTADTIAAGDEIGAGPLTGIKLGIPVYHILEEQIKKHCDKKIFEEQCEILEMILPVDEIIPSVVSSRAKYSKF